MREGKGKGSASASGSGKECMRGSKEDQRRFTTVT